MTALAFFTDEDFYAVIAPALRRAGLDAVSTPEALRRASVALIDETGYDVNVQAKSWIRCQR